MVFDRVRLGRRIAFALAGHDVQQLRPFQGLDVTDGGKQNRQVMAVDWADTIEAEFLVHVPGYDETLDVFLRAPRQFVYRRQVAEHPFPPLTHSTVKLAGNDFGEMIGQGADIG